jgi:UrcA family protein
MNTSARLPRILAITIFGAMTCGVVTMSSATDRFDASQMKVQYGDLDVSSASGAAALYKRIQGAAETVCHQWEHGDLYYRNLFYTCIRKTMNNAINALNQPVLFTIAANARGNAKAALITAKVIVTSNGK